MVYSVICFQYIKHISNVVKCVCTYVIHKNSIFDTHIYILCRSCTWCDTQLYSLTLKGLPENCERWKHKLDNWYEYSNFARRLNEIIISLISMMFKGRVFGDECMMNIHNFRKSIPSFSDQNLTRNLFNKMHQTKWPPGRYVRWSPTTPVINSLDSGYNTMQFDNQFENVNRL